MISKSKFLTKNQIENLNDKHGYFAFGDSQGDVSASYADDAISTYKAMQDAAPTLYRALLMMVVAAENVSGEHVEGLMDLDNSLAFAYKAIELAKGNK